MAVTRFSSLNLYPKNWTFPCTVDTYDDFKVRQETAHSLMFHLLEQVQYLLCPCC